MQGNATVGKIAEQLRTPMETRKSYAYQYCCITLQFVELPTEHKNQCNTLHRFPLLGKRTSQSRFAETKDDSVKQEKESFATRFPFCDLPEKLMHSQTSLSTS